MILTKNEALVCRRTTEDRIQWMLSRIEGKYALDISCGSGEATRAVASPFVRVTGLDYNEQAIQEAVGHESPVDGIMCICADIESFESNGMFDCVIMGNLLDCLAAPELAIAKVESLLKHQGIVIATIPLAAFEESPHEKTYSCSMFIQDIERRFQITDIVFADNWVGIVARRADGEPIRSCFSREVLSQIEDVYADRLYRSEKNAFYLQSNARHYQTAIRRFEEESQMMRDTMDIRESEVLRLFDELIKTYNMLNSVTEKYNGLIARYERFLKDYNVGFVARVLKKIKSRFIPKKRNDRV